MPIVYFDGALIEESDARVPIDDPALLWGVGLFEVARGYNGRAFRLERHLERLRRSALALGLDARVPPLDDVVCELFRVNAMSEGAVRVTWTGGGHLAVTVRAFPKQPDAFYRKGAPLRIAPWRRDPRAPLAGHKTLNYYTHMVDRQRAWDEGAVDTLMLGPRGDVQEGTRSNVFAVADGALLTPPRAHGILPGITRETVLEVAAARGIPQREQRVTFETLVEADEVFVTSTLMEVVPIRLVGDAPLRAPGPVTRRIARGFRALVHRECGAR